MSGPVRRSSRQTVPRRAARRVTGLAAVAAVATIGITGTFTASAAGATLGANALGTPAAAQTTVNSVARVIADMNGPNEGAPHGVPSSYDWYSGPVLYAGANDPSSQYHAITMWGQVYEAAQGSPATNVRVELRAAQCWIWSISQARWIEVQDTTQVQGAHFDESFATNASQSAAVRTEADGGTSTTMIPGYNFHFWPTISRVSIDPSDVGGVYTTVQARLVEDDSTGVNDLSAAQYLVNVGADYWTTTTAAYPNNSAVFEGRFDYVTPQWQAFNAISWTSSQILANPPPVADAPTAPAAPASTGGGTTVGTTGSTTGQGGFVLGRPVLATPASSLPESPLPLVLPLSGAGLVLAWVGWRRRRVYRHSRSRHSRSRHSRRSRTVDSPPVIRRRGHLPG